MPGSWKRSWWNINFTIYRFCISRDAELHNLTGFVKAFNDELLCSPSSRYCECLEHHGKHCDEIVSGTKPKITVQTGLSWVGREARMGLHACARSQCLWMHGGTGPADIFIESTPIFNPEKSRVASQQHNYSTKVLINMESMYHYPDTFNDTKNFQLGYTYVISNQRLTSRQLNYVFLSSAYSDFDSFRLPIVPVRYKKNAVAALISNCKALDRLRIINQLMELGVIVHSFGKCARNAAKVTHAAECAKIGRKTTYLDLEKLCIIRSYKFTLAIENSRSLGYVTEKLFQPLLVGSVPIYMGAPDVTDVLPHDMSVIHISDFPTIDLLGSYLRRLMNDTDAYEEHLEWRQNQFSIGFRNVIRNQFNSLHCKVCDDIALVTGYQLCEMSISIGVPKLNLTLIILSFNYFPEHNITQFSTFFKFHNSHHKYEKHEIINIKVWISYDVSNEPSLQKQRCHFSGSELLQCLAPSILFSRLDIYSMEFIHYKQISVLPLKLCPVQQHPSDNLNPRIGICAVMSSKDTSMTLESILIFVEYYLAYGVEVIKLYLYPELIARFNGIFAKFYARIVTSIEMIDVSGSRDELIIANNHCSSRTSNEVDWLGFIRIGDFLLSVDTVSTQKNIEIMLRDKKYTNRVCLQFKSIGSFPTHDNYFCRQSLAIRLASRHQHNATTIDSNIAFFHRVPYFSEMIANETFIKSMQHIFNANALRNMSGPIMSIILKNVDSLLKKQRIGNVRGY